VLHWEIVGPQGAEGWTLAELWNGAEAAAAVTGQINSVAVATRALEGVMMNRNPADTDAAHIKKVHQAGERLAKSLEAARQRGTETLNATAGNLADKLRAQSGIRPPENVAEVIQQSEIRQALLGMNPEQRASVLNDALRAGDVLTINAIHNGAAYLSGVEPARIKACVEAHQKATAPEVMQEFDAMMEADGALQASIRAAERAAADARDERAMQKILAAEAAANDAARAFGDAV
jgi:hypothetical protein